MTGRPDASHILMSSFPEGTKRVWFNTSGPATVVAELPDTVRSSDGRTGAAVDSDSADEYAGDYWLDFCECEWDDDEYNTDDCSCGGWDRCRQAFIDDQECDYVDEETDYTLKNPHLVWGGQAPNPCSPFRWIMQPRGEGTAFQAYGSPNLYADGHACHGSNAVPTSHAEADFTYWNAKHNQDLPPDQEPYSEEMADVRAWYEEENPHANGDADARRAITDHCITDEEKRVARALLDGTPGTCLLSMMSTIPDWPHRWDEMGRRFPLAHYLLRILKPMYLPKHTLFARYPELEAVSVGYAEASRMDALIGAEAFQELLRRCNERQYVLGRTPEQRIQADRTAGLVHARAVRLAMPSTARKNAQGLRYRMLSTVLATLDNAKQGFARLEEQMEDEFFVLDRQSLWAQLSDMPYEEEAAWGVLGLGDPRWTAARAHVSFSSLLPTWTKLRRGYPGGRNRLQLSGPMKRLRKAIGKPTFENLRRFLANNCIHPAFQDMIAEMGYTNEQYLELAQVQREHVVNVTKSANRVIRAQRGARRAMLAWAGEQMERRPGTAHLYFGRGRCNPDFDKATMECIEAPPPNLCALSHSVRMIHESEQLASEGALLWLLGSGFYRGLVELGVDLESAIQGWRTANDDGLNAFRASLTMLCVKEGGTFITGVDGRVFRGTIMRSPHGNRQGYDEIACETRTVIAWGEITEEN